MTRAIIVTQNTSTTPMQPLNPPPPTLPHPSPKKSQSKTRKFLQSFSSAFKSLPAVIPSCKIPVSIHGGRIIDGQIHGGQRVTGTLLGHRKSRVNLAFQQNPRCLPMLLLELSIPTEKLLQDMGLGLVRITLECEKDPAGKTKLVDEPIWTLYCNGRKTGYAVKRKPNNEDLNAMQTLHAVSMGAGVMPAGRKSESPDGDVVYMRAFFERVIGSKDSDTYHMINPDSNTGPELSIFFIRI